MSTRKLLGELLMESGQLTAQQLDQALGRQRETGQRLGRILIENGAISDMQLLEALSDQLNVAVAPAARLRLVRPSRQALRMVPATLAQKRKLLPIFFSEQEQSLTLVVADPQDTTSMALIKEENSLSRLRILIGDESLLDELVTRHYGLADQDEPSGARHATPDKTLVLLEPDDRQANALGSWLTLEGFDVIRVKDAAALSLAAQRAKDAIVLHRQSLDATKFAATLRTLPSESIRRLPPAREILEEGASSTGFSNFYIKTLDFFFSLIEGEQDAPSQRHLRQVSQLSRLIAKRLGLPAAMCDTLAIAGFLYQFGDFLIRKGIVGQKGSGSPGTEVVADLWENFGSPLPVPSLLRGLAREHGQKKERPLTVAILDAVTTYLEVRDGSKTHARLGHDKALRRLQENQEGRFDPRVTTAIQELVAKEHMLGQMEASQSSNYELLLVDKDHMALEVLELRLNKEGFQVRTARNGDEALKTIQTHKPNLVISEITLPRIDGFELCAKLKRARETQNIPFFFLSSRTDALHVTKGIELGADDFLTKPVNLDILVSKIRRLERLLQSKKTDAPSGVQGSLSEMGLFDLLQVLQLGMKSVKLHLEREGQKCEIYLDQGNLVYAELGELRGPDAFFELCTWENGTFAVSPAEEAPERNLHESNDFLLMEGMRRADERKAGLLSNEASRS